MLLFAPLLVSAILSGAVLEPITAAAVLEAPTRHIRAPDRSVRRLLRRGFELSPTFADLIVRLQRSDVFVYIEELPRMPAALDGRLMMLPRAHDHRYVRIQIALRGSPEDSIAVIGHELQHAIEVAEATEVNDQEGLARLYQRIGMRGGEHMYDTLAAQDMGRRVRRELQA